MSEEKFCFHLFDPVVSSVLSECNYINLPFELQNVFPEVNYLLTKCGRTFYCSLNYDVMTHLEECGKNAKIVLDIAWEKINTGYWKDVDQNWRYAYTLASLFNVLCLLLLKKSKKEIIKKCDMALLMGAPLMKNIMSRIASKMSSMTSSEIESKCSKPVDLYLKSKVVSKKQKTELASLNSLSIHFMVLECSNISLEKFISDYEKQSKPIILLDVINDWPAFTTRQWSVDYIVEKCRHRTVPVEIGSKYTDDNWTQKLMTIEDFVSEYIWKISEDTAIGYLAQHNLFNQIPELFDDIKIPTYIANRAEEDKANVDINVYFGPGGTISPLHFDPMHNLLAQVFGEKYIRLYSKTYTNNLYPRENTWLSNTSQVDVENPDFDQFPLFKEAPYEECILRPGNLLYIPPGCWHYVRSLSTSLSISFWW